jgi:hypothetical protein
VPAGDSLALADAILDEFARRRAGSSALRASVARRAMTEEAHLMGLEVLYDAAASCAA